VSSISRWSYTERASVRPFVSKNGTTNQVIYGPAYEIFCDFAATSEQHRDEKGNEFTSKYLIYTEDDRPKYLDEITLIFPGAKPQEIRAKTMWPMSAFGDIPDYLLVT
jgi:hypothetical protein